AGRNARQPGPSSLLPDHGGAHRGLVNELYCARLARRDRCVARSGGLFSGAIMTAEQLERYRSTLAGSVVFERLGREDPGLVMAACRLVEVQGGQLLLSEGKKGDGLYIILSGEVEFFLPERAAAGARRPSR